MRKKNIIIVNFKTYSQGTGKSALRLAKMCEEVSRKYKNVVIVLAVQTVDIHLIASSVTIPIIAQHVDPIMFGSHTGHTLIESIIISGAVGSLVNHSEHQLLPKDIRAILSRLKKKKMLSILCVKNAREAKKYAKYNPDFIAIEPPKLIGGTISVATAKPELIKETVSAITLPVLVGAGVHEKTDVIIATTLGAKGVLVASDILKAKNPKKELEDLARGF